MGISGLLADQIPATGHPVLQGNRPYLYAVIVVDHLVLRGIHRIELHLKTQVVGKEGDLSFEDRAQFLGTIHMQRCRTPHQSEGGDHTDQSETMVPVQMGDKHMTELRKTYLTASQLHLRTLGTIEHEQLSPHFDHLRRSVMTKGGKRTSAPQDMHFKRFQRIQA